MKLRSVFAALNAALLCILLAASPAGSGSMTLLGVGKAGAGAIPLSIDGTPVHTTGSASTIAGTITTTQTNDIVIAVITTNGGPVVGVAGGGLTWAKRASQGSSNAVELWWALAASPLSSVTITATQTSAAFNAMDIFAINGAKTSAPFDVNVSLPATSATDPVSVSTTAANTMILGAFRNSTGTTTAGTGFTIIGGADFQLSEYKIVSAVQTGLSVTMGTGAGTSNGAIGDAVVQGP